MPDWPVMGDQRLISRPSVRGFPANSRRKQAEVAFALIAGMNVYNAQQSDVMSDLALANVEALASGESSTTNRYQTMGYCAPLNMNYMCTSRRTAESCRRPCR